MRKLGILSLLVALGLLLLLPLLFGEIMGVSLAKLHLNPHEALLVLMGIIFGGFINIPVTRVENRQDVTIHPLSAFGFHHAYMEPELTPRRTLVAVNVGGCLIPAGLVVYELTHLAALGAADLATLAVACAVNTLACFWMARPIPGLGIALPGLLPALLSASLALLLAPAQTAPFAFVVGVTGTLLGADLLHLKDLNKVGTFASIGGAGTFDGIVLSGILAAYLA